ncbi:MAG: hypothetical protein HS128_14395 [Ideonella sp.]|nr:hypothetical protein [Ideonella sp.]MCC7459643.1 hypothetical protein [Nitrospira sp.]
MDTSTEPRRRARGLPPPWRHDDDEADPLGEWTLDDIDGEFDFAASRAARDLDAIDAD